MGKGAYYRIQIQAGHNAPDHIIAHIAVRSGRAGKERKHTKNKQDIKQVGDYLHLLFTPSADTRRRQQHAPKGGVAVNGGDHCVCRLGAGAAVVAQPIQNIGIRCLQKAQPTGQGDNPEILVLGYLAQSIGKLDLNHMGLCLNNLFLGIGIYHEHQQRTDHTDYRKSDPVHTDIRLVYTDNTGDQRDNNVIHRGAEGVNNALNGGHICTLLRIWREHMDQVLVRIIEEIIEELQGNVKRHNHGALCHIGSGFA